MQIQKISKLIMDKVNLGNARQVINYQKPVLDISCNVTKKADSLLEERNLKLEIFNGTPKIIVQLDRDPITIPDDLEETEQIEQYVISLLQNEDLTIKLETDEVGGIFRWNPGTETFLLVVIYGVNPSRNKHQSLPSTDFPIRLIRAGNVSSNRPSLGKILFSTVLWMKENQREQLDIDYKKFLNKSFQPFFEFLYYERLSIRDPRYRPQCSYVKLPSDDERGYLEVNDPPRQITEGGNQISARDSKGNVYLSVRVSDYDETDQVLIIEDKDRIEDWPEEGIIFLEGDMASNRRKMQAVNLLIGRKDPTYSKLADLLIRPWGLPPAEVLPRSYFHPNISHALEVSKGQAEAIDLALSSDDISLIHGPPGTGKTTVIVEIIRHMVANGKRVLMVAPTHVAVDNVLERVAHEKGVVAVRVGGRKYMPDHLRKYRLQERVMELKDTLPSFNLGKGKDKELESIQKEFLTRMESNERRYFENLVLDQANLVCGTTIGIARFYEKSTKNPVNFDMLIIDEASKATVMEFLVPAVRARRWVLVGDHRQLPPYVNDQELRIYVQRYFENLEEENGESSSSGSSRNRSSEFDERTEELVGHLRRFHEELHALSEGQTDQHWNKIVELLQYDKKAIQSVEEMVNLALGSCFHYFLQRLDDSRNAVLTYQHRMPSILANFLDENIYMGLLKTSTDAATHGFTLPKVKSLGLPKITEPLVFVSTENYPNPHDSPGRWKGYRNSAEADSIAEIISALITMDAEKLGFTDENPMTIGVITYYADQSREINNQLRLMEELVPERGWRYSVPNKPIKVRVSIVDRFQGQEQDIVLLSLTRSNPKGNIGFLKNLQRINVSLSRAKHNLIVIGNHRFFLKLRKREHPIILQELAKYAKAHGLVRKIKFN